MRKTLIAIGLLALSGAATAATNTGNVNASGTAVATCLVKSASLDFGSLPGVIRADKDSTGLITLTCSKSTAYTVYADQGLHETSGSRAMAGPGTAMLKYQLFADAARTVAIDGSTTGINGNSGAGGDYSFNIYGRIPSGQAVDVGAFADTGGLTVAF